MELFTLVPNLLDACSLTNFIDAPEGKMEVRDYPTSLEELYRAAEINFSVKSDDLKVGCFVPGCRPDGLAFKDAFTVKDPNGARLIGCKAHIDKATGAFKRHGLLVRQETLEDGLDRVFRFFRAEDACMNLFESTQGLSEEALVKLRTAGAADLVKAVHLGTVTPAEVEAFVKKQTAFDACLPAYRALKEECMDRFAGRRRHSLKTHERAKLTTFTAFVDAVMTFYLEVGLTHDRAKERAFKMQAPRLPEYPILSVRVYRSGEPRYYLVTKEYRDAMETLTYEEYVAYAQRNGKNPVSHSEYAERTIRDLHQLWRSLKVRQENQVVDNTLGAMYPDFFEQAKKELKSGRQGKGRKSPRRSHDE